MRPMRKIAVKGTSGCGKTTFAAELARRLGIAHVELDALHHGPNWTETPAEEFRARVRAAMDANPDGWVIDGNYERKLGEMANDAADTVIWLDMPLGMILNRLWRRTSTRIRDKVELWNGNREHWVNAVWGMDSLFVWAIRAYFRHQREWPAKFACDPRFVRLRTPAAARAWLERETVGSSVAALAERA